MGGIGFDTWSDDPPEDKLRLIFGAIFVVVGALLFAHGLIHLSSQPWDLGERGVETVGVKAEHDSWIGDRYRIEVDGRHYTCHRGQQKLARPSVPVLYDPEDPSRCRAKDTADRPGDYEYTSWKVSIPVLLFGVSIVLAHLAEPREKWARTNPEGLLRPKLMWISRGLAVLGVLSVLFGPPAIFGEPHGGGVVSDAGP